MRILVTGVTGFVGSHLAGELSRRGHAVAGVARRLPAATASGRAPTTVLAADLARPGAPAEVVARVAPDAVVNAAAVADIGPCERDPAGARRLNGEMPGELAAACATAGARLVHLSTDQVFDGSRGGWREADEPRPLHLYGAVKLAGERAVARAQPAACIVRAALVTGRPPPGRRSATASLLAALRRGERPGMFTDEVRSPIAVLDLARALADLLEDGAAGLWHAGGPQALSRYELARREAEAAGLDPDRVGASTRAAAGLAATRPADLSLDSTRLLRRLGWAPATLRG